MVIEIKFFDNIEINDSEIIDFVKPILGFDEFKKYILIDIEDTSIKCLQSIENKDICFLVSEPWQYFSDYEFDVFDQDKKLLELNEENAVVLNIMNIPGDIKRMSINLMAPIIINNLNKSALQIVLNNQSYRTKHLINVNSNT